MRELCESEIDMVTGGNPGDIVVTAHMFAIDPSQFGIQFTSENQAGNRAYEAGGGAGGSSGNASDANHTINAAVTVSASASHSDAATTAAQNVAKTLAIIEYQLQQADPNSSVSYNGHSYTPQALLNELHNTQFIITDDSSQLTDIRSGSAVHDPTTGLNTDTLYYSSFEGPGSYADSNYKNNVGMNAIMLHELGHMTEDGFNNSNSSAAYYYQENHHSYNGYGTSDYFQNNERFANDLAVQFAVGFDINIEGSNPVYGTGAELPADIHNDHMGN